MWNSGTQFCISTNWKPGSDGSNFTHSTSDSANTIRLVQSAVQRAFEATVAASPRTVMMTTQPSSGRKLSSDSRGKPAWFIVSPKQHEDAEEHDHADQHG